MKFHYMLRLADCTILYATIDVRVTRLPSTICRRVCNVLLTSFTNSQLSTATSTVQFTKTVAASPVSRIIICMYSHTHMHMTSVYELQHQVSLKFQPLKNNLDVSCFLQFCICHLKAVVSINHVPLLVVHHTNWLYNLAQTQIQLTQQTDSDVHYYY